MQQIGDWLAKLGLSEYADGFAENGIDFSVLPDLTDQDLKEIGVILGHRRKILRAIADLESGKSAPAIAAAPPARSDFAERRQVTVMFSDLVGSTALSARMDPEDLREVISAYQKCVKETVERLGGFVAKYMGDGVLVYFGYPQAHEDDAERAVRAGLELVTAVGALKTHAPLQTRVGIATGLVVVGDLIGSGASQEQAIVGETPNLAARLQSIAEPNAVVIAESTRKLVGNLFELEDLGAKDLKGIAGPVRAWAALRPSVIESRFEALHVSGLTELAGREEELELLLRRWSKAKSGQGQVVLLSGEPGIGKSRMTAALLERLAAEPHTRLRYFCSPQHTDSAFYPIIGQMERAAGFARDDTTAAKLDKLDAVLAQTSTSKEDTALFAEMLSMANDGRYPALDLAPQQRRQKTFHALGSQIEALTRTNPVLMILEDAHWADPTSLEAFGRAVEQIAQLRVLLIVTYRPEFAAPWIGRPHVSTLTLNRLGQREIAAMIDGLAGNKALPTAIRQDIMERTDGIPLFVEEMTKAVLEAKSLAAAAEAVAMVPQPALAVPASLHASLMARLDRLGASAKEVAQIGAAIGREFSHALLAAVVLKPEAELQSALDRIVAAGLLFQQGVPPHATYLFKHVLVQDAAYGTLLREPRRALHARIAETLERQFVDNAESQPELLARHCTEAGLIEKAAALWGKAGQRSLQRSALVEAVAQFKRTLGLLGTLPGSAAVRREQIKIQIGLVNAVMHAHGHGARETKEALDQARLSIERVEALGEPLDDPLALFSVLYGFWVANLVAFDGNVIRDLSAQFLALAEKQRAVVPRMVGHRILASSLLYTGEILEARDHYDRAIALYNPAEHRSLATRFGQDIRVAILTFRCLAQWILGYPDQALTDADRAIKEAHDIGHAVTVMFALANAAKCKLYCGKYAAAQVLVDELISTADETGGWFWKVGGLATRGWFFEFTGQPRDAIEVSSSAIAAWRAMGSKVSIPSLMANLAKAHADLNEFDEAWRCVGEAISTIETTRETWEEAEVDRLAGEIALMSREPDTAKAEVYFERALTVARQQQAKSWELRAAMSLACLWRDQGKVQQARELLAPVYGWFTEGFDTRDLKEAKALLEELAA
jgi:class 3 adenylate cyclase/predicted ATPase